MRALSIRELREACLKILGNVHELIEEAELLLENESFARSFALAHLASEEIMKTSMILRAATDACVGLEVDWEKLERQLQDHKVKIHSIIVTMHLGSYLNEPIPEEVIRSMDEDLEHWKEYNESKNLSLYASWRDDKFIKPSEVVTADQARTHIKLARGLLNCYGLWEQLTEAQFEEVINNPTFKERILKHHEKGK